MMKYIKYLWKNKGKLVFLTGITAFVIAVLYVIYGDETSSIGLRIGATAFVSIVEFLAQLQVWREYKGYEGLFGRK